MQRLTRACRGGAQLLAIYLAGSLSGAAAQRNAPAAGAAPLSFTVDFGSRSALTLRKEKFGVYQTPLIKRETLLRSLPFLKEAGIHDLRYEMGWGKPDALAYDQVRGTAAAPVIDFGALDPFITGLKRVGVRPLLVLTYDPLPLKTGTEWQRWKDPPQDLAAYEEIVARYAAHYRRLLGPGAAAYEVWNEPDLPGDGGKVFFNGSPAQYRDVYRAAAAGIRRGDPHATVGGPAIAYDTNYVGPILAQTLDFASIHAYDNFRELLAALGSAVRSRPGLPLRLTEYASFKEFGPKAAASRYPAAMRFFRDVKGLLLHKETAKVYWAQWVDDAMGLLNHDLHRKALFNAFLIYQSLLPVDGAVVSPDGAGGVQLMAASDKRTAGVVIWNESREAQTINVLLRRMSFRLGTLRVYRIDSLHASYVDNPASEQLLPLEQAPITNSTFIWTGVLPAESVLFLRASNSSAK